MTIRPENSSSKTKMPKTQTINPEWQIYNPKIKNEFVWDYVLIVKDLRQTSIIILAIRKQQKLYVLDHALRFQRFPNQLFDMCGVVGLRLYCIHDLKLFWFQAGLVNIWIFCISLKIFEMFEWNWLQKSNIKISEFRYQILYRSEDCINLMIV